MKDEGGGMSQTDQSHAACRKEVWRGLWPASVFGSSLDDELQKDI
jgi:hypothetical protein